MEPGVQHICYACRPAAAEAPAEALHGWETAPRKATITDIQGVHGQERRPENMPSVVRKVNESEGRRLLGPQIQLGASHLPSQYFSGSPQRPQYATRNPT